MDGQGTTWRRNIAENLNRLSRVQQRYRRQTDRQTDRRTADDIFKFAKNDHYQGKVNKNTHSLTTARTIQSTQYVP